MRRARVTPVAFVALAGCAGVVASPHPRASERSPSFQSTPAPLAGGPEAGPVRSAEQAAQRLVAAGIDSAALYVRLWIWPLGGVIPHAPG